MNLPKFEYALLTAIVFGDDDKGDLTHPSEMDDQHECDFVAERLQGFTDRLTVELLGEPVRLPGEPALYWCNN